jgi:hypothetical protein
LYITSSQKRSRQRGRRAPRAANKLSLLKVCHYVVQYVRTHEMTCLGEIFVAGDKRKLIFPLPRGRLWWLWSEQHKKYKRNPGGNTLFYVFLQRIISDTAVGICPRREDILCMRTESRSHARGSDIYAGDQSNFATIARYSHEKATSSS